MGQIAELHRLGQSLWYDNIQRRLLENGTLTNLVETGDIRGITSNPSIFNKAIAQSDDYDTALVPMAWAGWNAEQIFDQLVLEDIRSAADLFLPLYQETEGRDGFVSIEVNPFLAKSTTETVEEAKRLWMAVDRPNVMIKIPATVEGVPAIEQAIATGINVNVTLIFSLERYQQVMQAYLSGLEQRVKSGQNIDRIASVASFFVSRVDTKVDKILESIIHGDEPHQDQASRLLGKAAIANAKLAYASFLEVFGSDRFKRLVGKGARVQRPLWASTSTKNPSYRDVLYVEELIGPDTVNTVPPQTLDAFRDHGHSKVTLTQGVEQAKADLLSLEALGISMQQVTLELEQEGVKAFSDAFQSLLRSIEDRRAKAIEELGPLQATVRIRVGELEKQKVSQRLWDNDINLWADDIEKPEDIEKQLNWLQYPQIELGNIPSLDKLIQLANKEDNNNRIVSIETLGNSAAWMAAQCADNVPSGRNPGLVFGAILIEAKRHSLNNISILTDPGWDYLENWLVDLLAILQKDDHQERFTISAGLPERSTGALKDDLLVYVSQEGELNKQVEKLIQAGTPVITLRIADENDLGALMYLWKYAAIISELA